MLSDDSEMVANSTHQYPRDHPPPAHVFLSTTILDQNMSASTFDDLPAELHLDIVSELPSSDLNNLRLVRNAPSCDCLECLP